MLGKAVVRSWPGHDAYRLSSGLSERCSLLHSTDVEMRVLAALQAIASNSIGEDDLVEFKAVWPDADKEKFVRQLAGSLNRSAGEPVILVIGVDEKSGAPQAWRGREMSNWWPSVQKHFDEAIPELLRDITMEVQGKPIRALAIASDRAPYVLKTSHGISNREIPIREGTRTRSAWRGEILNMLAPAVRFPKMDVLRSGIYFIEEYGHPDPAMKDDGGMRYTGFVDVFVENIFNRSSVMIPRHRMVGELSCADLTVELIFPVAQRTSDYPSAPEYEGIIERVDGFVISGPGVMRVQFRSEYVDWDEHKKVLESDSAHLSIELPVSGTNKSGHLRSALEQDRNVVQRAQSYSESESGLAAYWAYQF